DHNAQLTSVQLSGNTSPGAVRTYAFPFSAQKPLGLLAPIDAKVVDEGSLLTFEADPANPDAGRILTYSLDSGAPPSASIDPESGLFTWTPPDGPAGAQVTIRATVDGVAGLSDRKIISITVNNVPPIV